MRNPLGALAPACALALLAPACAYADIGLKQEVTAEGTIAYFDFDGMGYVIVAVVALIMVVRSQRVSLKRMAQAKRKRAAHVDTAKAGAEAGKPEEEDLGARTLAAVERLKRAERAAREPRGPRGRAHAGRGRDGAGNR